MDIEIEQTPDPGRRSRLKRFAEHISQSIEIGTRELERARLFQEAGFVGFDAVHIACAESGKVDVFLTTDDRLLKLAARKTKQLHVKIENP